jgi:hypothetical protein
MASRNRKKAEKPTDKSMDKSIDKQIDDNEIKVMKVQKIKVNANDASAKVRLTTIIQLLCDDTIEDKHLQVALKHIKDMLTILETGKAPRNGSISDSAVIKAKRDMIIDILEQCPQNRNITIAIESLKNI